MSQLMNQLMSQHMSQLTSQHLNQLMVIKHCFFGGETKSCQYKTESDEVSQPILDNLSKKLFKVFYFQESRIVLRFCSTLPKNSVLRFYFVS